jgi:hypothetical protein
MHLRRGQEGGRITVPGAQAGGEHAHCAQPRRVIDAALEIANGTNAQLRALGQGFLRQTTSQPLLAQHLRKS